MGSGSAPPILTWLGFTQSSGSSLGLLGGSWWRDCASDQPPLPPEPLSSVSSLEVHFDLLDLTELTDMSDQELAEVFADSDDENLTSESPAGGAGVGAQRAVWGGLGLKTPPALDIASCKPLFLKIIFSQVCV